jgi:hypothetical protein
MNMLMSPKEIAIDASEETVEVKNKLVGLEEVREDTRLRVAW